MHSVPLSAISKYVRPEASDFFALLASVFYNSKTLGRLNVIDAI
jgi:hypothetical protein